MLRHKTVATREAVSLYFTLCIELLSLRLPGATPFDEGGLVDPAMLTNAPTLASSDEFAMNSW
jgi:hypothetical protein